MRLLLIDNHDSFSAILRDYLWELAGEEPLFFRNDALTRAELQALDFDAAVLSPGPGHPGNARDFGICRDLLDLCPDRPVLGVCLGHQGLARHAGAAVIPWPEARHGRPDTVFHDGTGVFRGLPPEFEAVRYHSLIVDPRTLPGNIKVTARAGDGIVLGLAFTDRPWHGVQFHPESIGTEHGKALLKNFLDLAKPDRTSPPPGFPPRRPPAAAKAPASPVPFRELPWREPAEVFARHFAAAAPAFWLDGAHPGTDSGWPATVMGRADSASVFRDWKGFAAWCDGLDLGADREAPWPGYRGGPVGHFAYELCRDTLHLPLPRTPEEPLARWMLPDGYLVFAHADRKVFAAWEDGEPPAWLQAVIDGWEDAAPIALPEGTLPPFAGWTPALSQDAYTARVRSLQRSIAAGDTYEACLTHAYAARAQADAAGVFLRLRARNPAPYAAWLAFPDVRLLSASPELFLEASPGGVLRSRPIKGTRPRGESAAEDARLGTELAGNAKDRAENRMIVDLTRHDFARVCLPGSVEVPSFLRVESHPAVFQLVSEVRGTLDPGRTAAEAVAACFPGGSMTGAPKERTVELLGREEAGPRGAYSGALGCFTRGGAFRLSMVIRTIENRGDDWRVGCGGAVLIDSDPEAEWREAVLKARSVIDAASA